MDDQQIIVLFGDSLLLDSVEAGLAHDEGWSVIRLRTAVPEVAARLQRLDPSLVIFDLDGVNFGSLMPFLKMKPGVPLLGLDINCANVVALACNHYTALNLRDLKDVILRHAGAALAECRPEMPYVAPPVASCAD